MAAVANAFLVAFGVDGALALLDEALRAAGSGALARPRAALAAVVLVSAPLVYLVTALSPQLPARLLAPLTAAAVWLKLGAPPIPLAVGWERAGLASALLQCLLAGLAALWIRRRSGATRWLLGDEARPPHPRPLLRAVGLLGGGALLAPVAALAWGALSLAAWLEAATAEFVAFHPGGISVAERVYARGEQSVRLVGMMHVGDAAVYEALFDSFAVPGTVVLEEGVTDREGRLEALLSYAPVARGLGLEAQEPLQRHFEEAWQALPEAQRVPALRHADVDASEFHPDTIAFLEQAARLWNAGGVEEALARLSAWAREPPVDLERIQEDVLTLRNRRLLDALEEALDDYDRVVVPWGALHLPWIERQLLRLGFVHTDSQRHPLIWWGPAAPDR